VRAIIGSMAMLGGLAGAAMAQPCCGPITPDGERLAHFLDDSAVTQRWLAGWHVDWRTGETDRAEPGGDAAKTHCSAFVAALAERLGAYVLRPPEHKQELLANAQMRWLHDLGAEQGWQALASYVAAQAAANRGELVLEASRTRTATGPAISRSCGRATRHAKSWTATVRRRRRRASRMRSAPRRSRGSDITPERGSRRERANCGTMGIR
jgi:hypothetical protein